MFSQPDEQAKSGKPKGLSHFPWLEPFSTVSRVLPVSWIFRIRSAGDLHPLDASSAHRGPLAEATPGRCCRAAGERGIVARDETPTVSEKHGRTGLGVACRGNPASKPCPPLLGGIASVYKAFQVVCWGAAPCFDSFASGVGRVAFIGRGCILVA